MIHVIRNQLRPNEQLYAVVDAAQDEQLALALRDDDHQPAMSLFEEPGATRLAHVAPWLTEIDPSEDCLKLWTQRLGGDAGILLISSSAVDVVRAHLRGILRVQDEEGEQYFFRFYDPRVLRAYFPTCTGVEAEEFFGPVRCFLVESEDAKALLQYSPSQGGVSAKRRVKSSESWVPARGRQ
jgi:hypothetical protein